MWDKEHQQLDPRVDQHTRLKTRPKGRVWAPGLSALTSP